MRLEFYSPVGFYPPVIWLNEALYGYYNRPLILANLLLRFIFYPFCFVASAIITLGCVLAATFFNICYLLGGFASDAWSEKTIELNQIAFSRCYWLILDVFGFLWNQAKLIIGFFKVDIGIDTLYSLKKINNNLLKKGLFHIDWQIPHANKIKLIMDYLDDQIRSDVAIAAFGSLLTSILISLFCIEIIDVLRIAKKMLFGLFGYLHQYGLNPDKLTDDQAKHPPLLLLHGNLHNQTIWLPFVKYLYKHNYPAPVFTIKLPYGNISKRDKIIINERMQKIKSLYTQKNVDMTHFKFNLVGYSRGAALACATSTNDWASISVADKSQIEYQIDKTILIGTRNICIDESKKNEIVYINGTNDHLLFFSSKANCIIPTGHLGLPLHRETHEACLQVLKH